MPTVIDATIVKQAYDTSGNGGRKLVRLSNGWLVTIAYDSINSILYVYKSTDNGSTWTQVCSMGASTNLKAGASIIANGTKVTVIYPYMSGGTVGQILANTFDVTTQTNTNIIGSSVIVDTNQTTMGLTSLAINSAGTGGWAAWASKNLTYPNSFNIRAAQFTINADGSVTWGTVEQVTNENTANRYFKNPNIVIFNGEPRIIVENYDSVIYWIKCYRKVSGSWGQNPVYDGGSYVQSSPTACVAPNGRIWVAWHGTDTTDTAKANIRVAYSDDGGVTWSSMQKLTSGNTVDRIYPSITTNKSGRLDIVYYAYQNGIRKLTYNGSWGSEIVVTSGDHGSPSTLYDLSLDYSEPLFIYKGTAKVGFYGTWPVTTISVTPGYIGQKTSADKSNILTYSITTDGTMSTITEKINGVTIATRTNPTSGQQFTISLTQEQWDAIKYGNAHTLTIEMGSDTWTYTFDKRLNANDDILSAVKGVQDLQTHLNGIKAQLGAAIRAKGGSVNDTDAWSAFVSAVGQLANVGSKRCLSGSGISDSQAWLTATGLTFTPSYILAIRTGELGIYHKDAGTSVNYMVVTSGAVDATTTAYKNGFGSTGYVNSTGFKIRLSANQTYTWIAIE